MPYPLGHGGSKIARVLSTRRACLSHLAPEGAGGIHDFWAGLHNTSRPAPIGRVAVSHQGGCVSGGA